LKSQGPFNLQQGSPLERSSVLVAIVFEPEEKIHKPTAF